MATYSATDFMNRDLPFGYSSSTQAVPPNPLRQLPDGMYGPAYSGQVSVANPTQYSGGATNGASGGGAWGAPTSSVPSTSSAPAPTPSLPVRQPAQVAAGVPAQPQKQFYRVGKDIFEAGTGRRIGSTEWGQSWSGKATEVSAPSSRDLNLPTTTPTPTPTAPPTSSRDLSFSGAPPTPPAPAPIAAPPQQPQMSAADSFQAAMSALLKQGQGLGGDEDLLKQRNALIQARFNAVNDTTPANFQVLSPSEQASLRNQTQGGLETQLSGVNTALQGRERQRTQAMDLVQQANSMLKDFQQNERANRDDARSLIKDQFTLFGGAAFGDADKSELTRLESQAGLPAGTLSAQKKTIKEQEAEAKAAQAAQTKYGSGSIGEYQFYAEQEKAAGREPMSYSDYQNEDANRKAIVAGTGGASAPASYKEWQLAGSPGTYAQWLGKSSGSIDGGGGRNMSAAQSQLLSEGANMTAVLSPIETLLKDEEDLFGPVAGRFNALNPYNTSAQTANAKLTTAAQMVGKYMEGGVLRQEDVAKYQRMLPQLSDTPEVAKNKLKNVQNMLIEKQNQYINDYEAAGFDVSGFRNPLKLDFKSESQPSLKGGKTQASAKTPENINRIANAIGLFESGGRYTALGPVLPSGAYAGQRAIGKYQIMPGNVASWSREALGYSVTPQQLLKSPQLQDAVAKYQMKKLLDKHGSPENVAAVWLSGKPLSNNNSRDLATGITVPQYVKNVMKNYYA